MERCKDTLGRMILREVVAVNAECNLQVKGGEVVMIQNEYCGTNMNFRGFKRFRGFGSLIRLPSYRLRVRGST